MLQSIMNFKITAKPLVLCRKAQLLKALFQWLAACMFHPVLRRAVQSH